MKPHSTFLRPFLVTAATMIATASAASAYWPNDHSTMAYNWIFNPAIEMDNNDYGTPADIWYDDQRKLHALARCNSFVNLLLEKAYPGVITDNVLLALTGAKTPSAERWYAAILNEAIDSTRLGASNIGIHRRTHVETINPGDILASSYTTAGATGHVMIVKSIVLVEWETVLPAGKSIPGVGKVNK
jgi:hypothetical protein